MLTHVTLRSCHQGYSSHPDFRYVVDSEYHFAAYPGRLLQRDEHAMQLGEAVLP